MFDFMLFMDPGWGQGADSQDVVHEVPEDYPDQLEIEELFIQWIQIWFIWLHLHEFFENTDCDVVANFLFLRFQKRIEPLLIKSRRSTILKKVFMDYF